jgi:ketosteroid isomerase-like protein
VALPVSILAGQENATDPCADPRFRGLDFWVGSWSVLSNGREVAESAIERLGAGCAIVESYRQADGYSGKSLNYVDPEDGTWRQVWIDRLGAVSEFRGEAGEGRVEFTGATRSRDGRALRRMALAAAGGGRVRQSSLISRDEGRTWQAHYSLEYVPAVARLEPQPCVPSGDGAPEADARAAAASIVEADNAAALDRILSFYSASAILLPPGSAPVGGLGRIRGRYEALLAEYAPAIETRIDRVCVGGSVAFVEGHNSGRLVRRGGGSDRTLDDSFLMVLRREGEAPWRIEQLAWR